VSIENSKEIEFLHDISNQIVIARGGAGFVFSRLKKKNKVEDDDLESIEKVITAIEKIIELIHKEKHQFKLK
jgi:hypothetical protein